MSFAEGRNLRVDCNFRLPGQHIENNVIAHLALGDVTPGRQLNDSRLELRDLVEDVFISLLNSSHRNCSSTSSWGILMQAQAERKMTILEILAPFFSRTAARGKAT